MGVWIPLEAERSNSQEIQVALGRLSWNYGDFNVRLGNIEESINAEWCFDQAMQVVSDILMKMLSSHISCGLFSATHSGASTAPSALTTMLSEGLGQIAAETV